VRAAVGRAAEEINRAKLYLPVLVPGALLSIGDCHAAQGDGEVCVTGIGRDMTLSLSVSVQQGPPLRPSTYRFRQPKTLRSNGPEAAVSAGGPDLVENARSAVLGMVEWLERTRKLTAEDAYLLYRLTVDLQITQIVNSPNYCVTALLPETTFDAEREPHV